MQQRRSLLSGGWPELIQHNHTQVLEARQHLSESLNIPLPCPEAMVGSMATLPLPMDKIPPQLSPNAINLKLWNDFQIEVAVTLSPDENNYLVRISSQIYNQPEEFERLTNALQQLML